MSDFLSHVRGRLIVSCQARAGHPLRDSAVIARMAQAAVRGGAAAIRCGGQGGAGDVRAVRAAVAVPVIGLTKRGQEGVYITPTVADARAIAAAGADVVAIDGTARPRPDGAALLESVQAIHAAGALAMADVSTVEEGRYAAAAGADVVASTLSGYTPDSPRTDDPDLALVAGLRAALPDLAILAEGRYHTPQQAAAALAAGADAVVVGTAITDPVWITAQFAAGLRKPGSSGTVEA
ncbi:MAG TPA: putative N-acetylmannosamine-6-phosphate 2-epimerase [Mycobacteriales bacterium]|nr:putative N-acetylmannosamine-6-phosphate 2-epimerase [Mycobacteriales bacterium]